MRFSRTFTGEYSFRINHLSFDRVFFASVSFVGARQKYGLFLNPKVTS